MSRDRFLITAQLEITFLVDEDMTEERRSELVREALKPLEAVGKGGLGMGCYSYQSGPAVAVETPPSSVTRIRRSAS